MNSKHSFLKGTIVLMAANAISKILGHSKEIVTADNYIDNQEIIADGVAELKDYIEDVLPQKPINYSEREKLFDCSDMDVDVVFKNLIA